MIKRKELEKLAYLRIKNKLNTREIFDKWLLAYYKHNKNNKMYETYFIVYPSGDRTKLCVASLSAACMYEKNDYDLASRREFLDDEEGATAYCRELANKHGLEFEGDSDGNAYLD